ncbi:MAG: prolyl oligopeptidase family serine peptidase [Bacteroidota bacterium]
MRYSFFCRFQHLLLVIIFCSCHHQEQKDDSLFGKDVTQYSTDFIPLQVGLQTINITGIPVDIAVPYGGSKGDVLVLPGWNFSRERWCSDSDLCKKALAKGYRLVMPEMGLSVYATHYYPQTRADWLNAPTGVWVTDTLIRYLQNKYGIFLPAKRNFLIGLSTGGRGVVMTALRTDNLFKAGASLSGDFDQCQTPYDNVMGGFYGTYQDNKQLWETTDNPMHDAASLKVPMYLGHGINDPVVPSQQTITFHKRLQECNPKLTLILHLSETGVHDFNYWNSEVEPALNFFEKF